MSEACGANHGSSYDVMFVRSPPGLDAAQTLRWFEHYEEDLVGDIELSDDDLAVWARIVHRATALYPDGADEMSREHAELTWATGILVEFWAEDSSVTVPYWHTGAEGDAVMEMVYGLGQIIAEESDRTGLDPQLQTLFTVKDLPAATRRYQSLSASRQQRRPRDTP